jgi:hypothetical protein
VGDKETTYRESATEMNSVLVLRTLSELTVAIANKQDKTRVQECLDILGLELMLCVRDNPTLITCAVQYLKATVDSIDAIALFDDVEKIEFTAAVT